MPSWPSASTGLVAVFAEKKTKTHGRNERERRDNDDDFIAFFRVRKKRKKEPKKRILGQFLT